MKMNLTIKSFWGLLVACILFSACQTSQHFIAESDKRGETKGTGMKVVPFVELSQYLGTWYEIARYPHSFEENCYASQANYSLRDDGDIRVINRCWVGGFDGKLNEAEGRAWIVDKTTNAKLKVQFFWPFSGHYWVIALDTEYQYAVVGHPSLKYLWVLSRSQNMEPQLYEKLLHIIEQQGYDTTKIILTPQPKDF